MATVEQVRQVALALPRAYEALVRDRVKFRVGRIVFAALSADETVLGFGYPKEAPTGWSRPSRRSSSCPASPTCATTGCRRTWPRWTRTSCASWSPTPGGCASRNASPPRT